MGKQIEFTQPPLSPKPEFRNRMPAATEKRTEALLAAYELLEVARQYEALDLVQGAISAKATIMEELAEFASKPAAVTGLRNLIVVAKIFAELDSETLSGFTKEMKASRKSEPEDPLSLWQLTRHVNDPDVRRGLSFAVRVLEALGRSVKVSPSISEHSE